MLMTLNQNRVLAGTSLEQETLRTRETLGHTTKPSRQHDGLVKISYIINKR
jgi:hypothetical protein